MWGYCLKSIRLKYLFISCLCFFALLGVDSHLTASYSNPDADFYDKEIERLWYKDPAGYSTFKRRVQDRLPQYRDSFESASRNLDVHWTLIAAISYQESHWDPRAISNTGVRGMMMLTQKTAKEMGIKKRTDPQQSIYGGANYFQKTFGRLPDSIPKLDRIWMSLAAYNLGFLNLDEARELTAREGKNPDNWTDVVHYLSLHLENRYGDETKDKKNKGSKAIEYVDRIKLYYQTLSILEKSKMMEESAHDELVL